MKKLMLGSSAIALLFGTVTGVKAQTAAPAADTLEEVVVTAERRESDAQKTALAVSVISADQVEKTGISTFENLLENIPGVQVQAAAGPAAVTPYIAIRGLGTDGANKPGATQLYLDGILTGNLGAELYDLSRVEVLRGPQGTLYGGSATGGAVNILSNDPNFSGYSGSAQIEVGNYGLTHEIGVLNMPLSDTVAMRAAVNTTHRNNYADGDDDFNSQTNARLKLLFKPGDAVSVMFGAEFYNLSGVTSDGTMEVNASGKPTGPYLAETGYGVYQGYRVYVNFNADLGFAKLTDITSVEKTHDDPAALSYMDSPTSLTLAYTTQPHKDTTTEELRLTSEPDSPVAWVVGLWDKYYYQSDEVEIGLGSGYLPITPAEFGILVPEVDQWQQYAAYGQLTIPLGDGTRFTGGLRESKDEINFNQYFTWTTVAGTTFPGAGAVFNCGPTVADPTGPYVPEPCTVTTAYSSSTTRTDWMARLEHDLSPNNLLYAMGSTGYRPGGDSAPRTSYLQPAATYNTESVRAYELGSKNRFLDNKLQVNGDVYYNTYPSFQNEITNFLAGAQIPSIVGIAATFYGAELEAAAALTPDDRLTVSASYIHAQYTANGSWTNPFVAGAAPLSIPSDGGTVPHAPKFQGNIDYGHTVRLGNGGAVVTDARLHYQTEQAVSFDPCLYSAAACVSDGLTKSGLEQGSYALFDLSASYRSPGDKFTATLYCRNCGGEVIKTSSTGALMYTIAAPATVGVVVAEKF